MADQVHLIGAIVALFGALVWLVKFNLTTMGSRLATKDDLAKLATKEDLREARERGVADTVRGVEGRDRASRKGQRQTSSSGEQPPRERMS